jgi:hypothetical protein
MSQPQHNDQCGEDIRNHGACEHGPAFPVHIETPATTHDSGRLIAYTTEDGHHHVERVSTSLADLLEAKGIAAPDPVLHTEPSQEA